MAVTVATVLARIRTRLNEATQRFYPDSASTGLISWYNDGASQQHDIVLGIARNLNLLTDMSHPYLSQFIKVRPLNIVVGTQLYDLPDDFEEVAQLSISDVSDLRENFAMYVKPEDDWFVRNLPHLQPTLDRPAWSLQADKTSGAAKIKVFVFGNNTKPNAPLAGRLYYYREVTPAIDTGNVDLLDPFNEGPIWYAVAQAYLKRGTDPSVALGLFTNAVQSIMTPAAAASATGQAAQAAGAAQQVAAGEARDSR